jgi:hypothetical protein
MKINTMPDRAQSVPRRISGQLSQMSEFLKGRKPGMSAMDEGGQHLEA